MGRLNLTTMIRTTLYISRYDWLVHCYFAVDCYYTHEIVSKMASIGASDKILSDSFAKMSKCDLNGGITYSNFRRRESVMVTELTSNAAEFLNSFVHETGHLATHIAIADNLDLDGEEVRYIHGDISRALFPFCHSLLCDGCRHKKYSDKNIR